MNLDRSLPEWVSYLLKVIFVMIFPLTVTASNFLQIFLLPSNGLLFPLIQYYPELLVDFSFVLIILSGILLNFILGIIIAIPGIYYSYKLAREPLHKSCWLSGIGYSAVIYFFTLGMVMSLSLLMYSPTSGFSDLWEVYMRVLYYPSLVFGVFIILPLVLRQAVIITVPPDFHHYSMRDIEAIPEFNVSREKLLSTIFWLFICFTPYSIQYNPYNWYGVYLFPSLLMDYRIGLNWYGYSDTFYMYFSGQMALFPYIPFTALLFTFNFAFVGDVYRYLRKTITWNRLMAMAIFSCLFPFFLSIGLGGMYLFGWYVMLPIPIPIIQIAGLLIVRYHRPDTSQNDRIWRGERSTIWWGSKKREETIQVQATPEKPFRHRDETINVPLRYRILSKIRLLKSRVLSE